MDEEARERISCTGGVIKSLLSIYFRPSLTEEQSSVCAEAGEALAMLAMENPRDCKKIMMEKDAVENLIGSLHDSVLRIISSRILMSLCAYSPPQYEPSDAAKNEAEATKAAWSCRICLIAEVNTTIVPYGHVLCLRTLGSQVFNGSIHENDLRTWFCAWRSSSRQYLGALPLGEACLWVCSTILSPIILLLFYIVPCFN